MKMKFLAIALFGLFAFASCSDDDDKYDDSWVSAATKTQLTEDIAAQNKKVVSDIKWEKKLSYSVAEFWQEITGKRYEVEMWYDDAGAWYMTETEVEGTKGQSKIDDALVTEAVKTAFKQSEYATWSVDDLDMIERVGVETIYVIEVETKGQPDVKLHYTKDGILVNTIVEENGSGHNGGLIPNKLPDAVKQVLDTKYPGYRLIEIDSELVLGKTYLEAEIVIDGRKKDALFDAKTNEWVWTKTEMGINEQLPTAVASAVQTIVADGWVVDDRDAIEAPQGDMFYIEFEKKGQADKKMLFDVNGNEVIIK